MFTKKSKKILSTFFIYYLTAIILFTGCTKFVQVKIPENQLVTGSVFSSDGSALSAINGIYSQMALSTGFASGGSSSVTQLAGLTSDEFINYLPGDYPEFEGNAITPTNSVNTSALWGEAYQYIYSCNAILEGVNSSNTLSTNVKNELSGEAKFLRAFCYFYLTNLYGDVPLYTTSNFEKNAISPKTTSILIYDQIVADLKDAKNLLNTDYSFTNGERVKPIKWAAIALLARVYLYEQKWDSAIDLSTQVIDNSQLYTMPSDLDSVFLKNSSETIWQLLPVQPGFNTQEGASFILTAVPTTISLTDFLISAFEIGDRRKSDWIGSYTDGTTTWFFAYKYKVQASSDLSEYSMVLRLAEQYLIRAESRARQNDLAGSESDLNSIRNRAGLPNTLASDQSSLLLAIEHERQVELFSEWGHRWFDLIRTNRADPVLGAEKAGWKSFAQRYPIPLSELQNNNQITQNPGY